MNGKTSISILSEFCAQRKIAPPQYIAVIHESDPSLFQFDVKAFNLKAKGTGRSKQEAKHAASKLLIDRLTELGELTAKVDVQTPRSPPTTTAITTTHATNLSPTPQNDNAIGKLITLCQHRSLQSPKIEEVSVTGESHNREFTFCCQLGKLRTYGKGSTKKIARRITAVEMFKLLGVALEEDDSISWNSSQTDISSINSDELVIETTVIPTLEVPTVEEVLSEYRRLKKPYIQPIVDGLRYRKNFFLNLPAVNRSKAKHVLTFDHAGLLTEKAIVDEAFQALGLKYEIKSMSSPQNYKRFCLLDSTFDCVIIEHGDKLLLRVIDYLETMLNIKNASCLEDCL